MKLSRPYSIRVFKAIAVLALVLATSGPVWANLPGGGTNGPNVALTDNGSNQRLPLAPPPDKREGVASPLWPDRFAGEKEL